MNKVKIQNISLFLTTTSESNSGIKKAIHKINQQTILYMYIKFSTEEFYDQFNYFEQAENTLPYYQ